LKALNASYGAGFVLDAYARFLGNTEFKSEAILRYQELVAREPENPSHLGLLGNLYLSAGFNSLAMSCYMRASHVTEGKSAWIEANIGNLLKNQGLYSEAIKYLKTAVVLDPDFQYAHERLAQAQKSASEEREKLNAMLKDARVTNPPQVSLPEPAA
jgi:predicted Zn-dependent protease